jgi:uncharacterized DUF497 family protein
MDIHFESNGLTFGRDDKKAARNLRKHGIRFEEAASVFDDPLFVLIDASRAAEARDAAIGLDAPDAFSLSFTSRSKMSASESFQHAGPSPPRRNFILNEQLRRRPTKGGPMTAITVRMPIDVVEPMKEIAPLKGLRGY